MFRVLRMCKILRTLTFSQIWASFNDFEHLVDELENMNSLDDLSEYSLDDLAEFGDEGDDHDDGLERNEFIFEHYE